MKLSVPCNWDYRLVADLAPIAEIYEMFGALNATPVGSGRPSSITNDVTDKQASELIKAVKDNGWTFNYLLNAPCMGNMEYDIPTHRELLSHLDWMSESGVDTVTVSIPYLVELIKKQYPHFSVKASVIANIDSVQRALYFLDLGVDEITVDYMQNRDFRFLKSLKQATECELTLLTNDCCLFQCPHRSYHYNACAHASQGWYPLQSYYFDYSMVRCSIEKLKKPESLLMVRWIRPEDLHHYEAIGYERFKISGRHMETDGIVKAVKAYVERSFDGNLMEILNPFVENGDRRFPRINNKALNGFLNYFKENSCDDDCDTCRYCMDLAEDVIQTDTEAVRAHQTVLENYINGLASSRFVPAKS